MHLLYLDFRLSRGEICFTYFIPPPPAPPPPRKLEIWLIIFVSKIWLLPETLSKYTHLTVVLGLLSTLTGGLPTFHIVPTEGFTKLRQVASLNETQVYPIGTYLLRCKCELTNWMIKYDWLNLSYNTFKVKCKNLILTWQLKTNELTW